MKLKHLFILLSILLVLVAGIVLKKFRPRPELATQEFTPLNLSFETPRAAQIMLSKKKQPAVAPQVQLKKIKDQWRVTNFLNARADQSKVDTFLTEIQKAKGELRGNSKETLEDFGITDEKAIQVKLAGVDDKPVLQFLIGTKQAGYGKVFIRQQGSNSVYLTEANLPSLMGLGGDLSAGEPNPEFWASQTLAVIDPTKVQRVELKDYSRSAPQSLILEQQNSSWIFADSKIPFPAANDKVNAYLQNIKSYAADKVLDPKAKDYGFSKPRWEMKLYEQEGVEFSMTAGNAENKEKSSYDVQVSGEPVVFSLSKYYLENLNPDASHFFADNLLNVDPLKTEKLVVHTGKTEVKFQPMAKKWDSLTSYLEGLKNFKVDKISEAKPKFGSYWLEIQKQGEPSVIMDFAETLTKDHKEYAAQKRGNAYVFSVSESLFKQLFDNPSRLSAPAK